MEVLVGISQPSAEAKRLARNPGIGARAYRNFQQANKKTGQVLGAWWGDNYYWLWNGRF